MKYLVLEETTLDLLVNKVNTYIEKQEYSVLGGIAIRQTATNRLGSAVHPKTEIQCTYLQAMIQLH